ncbi:Retrovirus-related Pol polyprotein from transposon 17.6 [Trichinella spiralis]|uniref:Retrovirus-related Pol polyprotein from transposon 17.6 n=1 Tax=Trichinella spiralis TaxID=6334 RepID=A0A0V1APJ6_TRISP|nr:Retrovirus-related Pol polyprotein from transposon 17.6 [Trichinella spiralis]
MLPSVEELDAHSRNAMRSVLWKYRRCIATSDEDLGHTELASHRIDTRNAAPVKVPPRRLPPPQRHDVQRMVTDMFSRNIIEPANSPWSALIVMVRKKDGSLRFCVDFCRLNDVAVKDAHPLPRIDDTLEELSGALDEDDRLKTAFSKPFGLYQFRGMPFDLCNAPTTFQRLMDVALRGLTWSSCLAYLDDIIVFGRSAQEHTDHLERVLQRKAETSLKLKPQKCHLMRKTVRFLGHILSENGISTDEEKIRAVKEWPTPCCPSETAFDQLRHMLCTAPVLTFPDFNVPFIVDVDTSAEGIGAVLSQLSHRNERVVAYASRTLTKFERRYCVTRKELLALMWSIKEFRPYLYGQQFDVRTDYSCLRWLHNFKEPEGQVARWLEQLAEYDFNVLRQPGRAHCNADALSRQRCPQCGISIVAAATLPVATMEKVAPSSRWPRLCPTSSDPDLRSLWRDGRGVFLVGENGLFRRSRPAATVSMISCSFQRKKAVDAWCQACRTCVARSESTRKSKAPLQTPEMSCAFQTLAMDFLGPLEATVTQRLPLHFGRLRLLLKMDRGISNAFPSGHESCRRIGWQLRGLQDLRRRKVVILALPPAGQWARGTHQSNAVEYAGQTLPRVCCHLRADVWDQLLPMATMAYNSAVHETTGQSPFCMLFGKRICLPLDATLDVPSGTARNAEDYIVQLRENLQKVHSTAFDQSRHEQQHNKEIADRKATANRFETDQLVWLKFPQWGKLDKRWSGPLRVLKQLGVETYHVQDVHPMGTLMFLFQYFILLP